jgi:hypothetical protein
MADVPSGLSLTSPQESKKKNMYGRSTERVKVTDFLYFGTEYFHEEDSCTLLRLQNLKERDNMENIPMYWSEDIHRVDFKETEVRRQYQATAVYTPRSYALLHSSFDDISVFVEIILTT